MNQISICSIMKNEKRHLESFLQAIQKAFFGVSYEIVLLDTGSSDESVAIGEKYGARVEAFPWQNDFSLAKNKCLSHAKNNLVLFLDCDEYVDRVDVVGLFTVMEKHPRSVGRIKLHNLLKDGGVDTVFLERVFDRRFYHYAYAVHEQVRSISGEEDFERIEVPIEVTHHGYENAEILKEKAVRNAVLLESALASAKEDPYLLYQRGKCDQVREAYEAALSWYQKALAVDVNPKLSYVQDLIVDYGNTLLMLERPQEALGLEGVYQEFSGNGDFVYLMGMIYLKNGYWESALNEFQKATTYTRVKRKGANSYLAWYHRGCIYEVTGNLEAAKREYEKCGDFAQAVERIAAMYNA